jgi:hypothetical protein
VDVAHNPGKNITATVTNQGALTHTIKGKLTTPSAFFPFFPTVLEINATVGHTPYNVKISLLKEGRHAKILVDVMNGSKSMLQLKLVFQVKARFKGDYIMGGLTSYTTTSIYHGM